MILGKRLINTGVEAACTTDTADVFGDSSGVALYTLDFDSSDNSSNGYDGTPTNVEFGVGGQINYGARFNGSSSYINLGNNASNNDSTFSVSLWFKTSGHSTTATLINNGGANSGERGYFLGLLSSGYLRFSTSELVTAFTYNGNVNYADGAWHHIVLSYDSGTYSIYVDGNTTPITSGTNGTFISTATRPTWIGRFSYDPSAIEFFNGDIDQVRLFTKALNSTEVSTLYAETACVYTCTTDTVDYPTTNVAYYKLDNSATDETGSYDGTINGSVNFNFGRFGQSAKIGGTSSDYIDLGTISELPTNTQNTVDFSWSGWVKATATELNATSGSNFFFNHSKNSYQLIGFGGNVSGNFPTGRISYYTFGGSGFHNSWIQSSNTYSDGNWHHVVVTDKYNSGTDNRTRTLYVDNVQVAQDTVDKQFNNSASLTTISTGDINAYGGHIDQVRIFNSILDTDQITQLYEEKPCADTSTFKTVLYEGNSSTQYISNVGFEPDFVWVKSRDSSGYYHNLFDSVRGATYRLFSSLTNAQDANGKLSSFDANGFSLISGGDANTSGQSMVAWCWKAGGDAVSNTDGSITSQVSANDKGFSIVKYTGNGTAGATIGHGLSAKPEFILIKNLDSALNWIAYDTNINSVGYLDLNDAFATSRLSWGFNNTDPTDTLITLGSNSAVNASSNDYIAYCFHSVSGVSKVGSYTGTGTSGNSITTGFAPRFVMIKRTDDLGNWVMFDSARGDDDDYLYANTNAVEGTSGFTFSLDTNSFTVGGTSSWINASGGTYIYLAFA